MSSLDEARAAWVELWPGWTFDRFITESVPQTQTFYSEMLPVLHKLIRKLPYGMELKGLDAGCGSASGADIIARLHQGKLLRNPIRMTGVDLHDTYKRIAETIFPLVEYKVADLFEFAPGSYDFCICSHVIEHFDDPTEFIRKIQQIGRLFSLFYAPLDERERIEGHLRTINMEYVTSLMPMWIGVRDSLAWIHPKDEHSHCVMFVLPGSDWNDLNLSTADLWRS